MSEPESSSAPSSPCFGQSWMTRSRATHVVRVVVEAAEAAAGDLEPLEHVVVGAHLDRVRRRPRCAAARRRRAPRGSTIGCGSGPGAVEDHAAGIRGRRRTAHRRSAVLDGLHCCQRPSQARARLQAGQRSCIRRAARAISGRPPRLLHAFRARGRADRLSNTGALMRSRLKLILTSAVIAALTVAGVSLATGGVTVAAETSRPRLRRAPAALAVSAAAARARGAVPGPTSQMRTSVPCSRTSATRSPSRLPTSRAR